MYFPNPSCSNTRLCSQRLIQGRFGKNNSVSIVLIWGTNGSCQNNMYCIVLKYNAINRCSNPIAYVSSHGLFLFVPSQNQSQDKTSHQSERSTPEHENKKSYRSIELSDSKSFGDSSLSNQVRTRTL